MLLAIEASKYLLRVYLLNTYDIDIVSAANNSSSHYTYH